MKNSKNYSDAKTIKPKNEFYKIYNASHVLDIVSSLDIYKEIPNQYSYFGIGAEYWDQYVQRLAREATPNSFNKILDLLEINQSYLDYICEGAEFVNVVDIGVGNAMPVKLLIAHLKAKGIFGKYIGIDLSQKMLSIARKNLITWFGNDFPYEEHIADMNHERFTGTLTNQYLKPYSAKGMNLVVVLGGTINNMRNPDLALRTIHDSLGKKDVLIHTLKLDSVTSRKYFDFNIQPGKKDISLQDSFILDLLNIDTSLYEVEMFFDKTNCQRQIRAKLKTALKITFHIDLRECIVEFDKDDSILLWRYWHQSAEEVLGQFNRTDFYPLQTSLTADEQYILTISKIKY